MTQTEDMKKHYWMASVVISFVHEGVPMDTSVNALLSNTEPYITKKILENAQVKAQIQLAKTMDNNLPDVKHVYIQSISFLGFMTEKEFLSEPEV